MAVKLSVPGGQHLLFLYLVAGFFFGGTLLCYGRIGLGISFETQNDYLTGGGPLESFEASSGPEGPSITPCEAGCSFLQGSCACGKKTETTSTDTTAPAKTTEPEADGGTRAGAGDAAKAGQGSGPAEPEKKSAPPPEQKADEASKVKSEILADSKSSAKATVVFLVAGMKSEEELKKPEEQNEAAKSNAKIMDALIEKSAAMAQTGNYMFVTGGASHWQRHFAAGMSKAGAATYNFAGKDGGGAIGFIGSTPFENQPAAFPSAEEEPESTYMKKLLVQTSEERGKKLLTALVADVYIVFKGGGAAPAEVTPAHERGALVVPVLFSGNKSSPDSQAPTLPADTYSNAKEWQKYDLCVPDKAEPKAIADAVWGQIEERRVQAKEIRKIILEGSEDPAKTKIVFLVAGMKSKEELEEPQEQNEAAKSNAKIMNALIEKAAEMADTGNYRFVTGGVSHWQHVFAKGMSGRKQTTYNFAGKDGGGAIGFIGSTPFENQPAAFPSAEEEPESTYMKKLLVQAKHADKELLTALVADAYVVFKGGNAAPKEVIPAHKKGALVVPVLCSGGSSKPGGALLEDIYNNAKTWQEQDEDLCASGKEDPKAIADAVWGQIAGNMEEQLALKFWKKHKTEGRVVIAVLGGNFTPQQFDSEGKEKNFLEKVVPAVAGKLANQMGDKVVFVTGGASDTQRLFGEGVAKAKPEARLYNLKGEPVTCKAAPLEGDWKGNTWGVPYPHNDPKDSRKAKLTGLLGDVVITISGREAVVKEANFALNNDAKLVPLTATGGFTKDKVRKGDFGASPKLWTDLEWENSREEFTDDTKVGGYTENVSTVVGLAVDAAKRSVDDQAKKLRESLKKEGTGDRVIVTVLGGGFPRKDEKVTDQDAEDKRVTEETEFLKNVVPLLAKKLEELGKDKNVVYVTGGVSPTQKLFAEHAAAVVHNLKGNNVPALDGWKGQPLDVPYFQKGDPRKDRLTGLLGEVVITIAGGAGVAKEAAIAREGGGIVIPLKATGGVSENLQDTKPASMSQGSWDDLNLAGGTDRSDETVQKEYAEKAANVILAAVDHVKNNPKSAAADDAPTA
ncbi:unnamed protein product [Amoebophrya sp. A25]|nr:unnamed protein product [Amoebophrya sp. A25]|eukprot:GSA25T00009071001.1